MIDTVIYSTPHNNGNGGGGTYILGSTKVRGNTGRNQWDDDIIANSGTFKYLNAQEGYIEKLSGKTLDFEDIKIEGIVSDVVNTKKLIADEAEIKKAIISELTSTNITTEYLTVTKQAHFFELIIDKLKSVGGQIILTPTNCILDFAKAFDSNMHEIDIDSLNENNISNVAFFRVYWRANDPVTNKSISNDWVVNDQALCQSFNNVQEGVNSNVSNKYYWRLVTNVSQSKVLCDVEQKKVAEHEQPTTYDDYIEYGFELFNDYNDGVMLADVLNTKFDIDMTQTLVGSNNDISIKVEKSEDDYTPFKVWTGHRTSNIGLQISDNNKKLAYNDLYSNIDQSLSIAERTRQINLAKEAASKVHSGIEGDYLCVRINIDELNNTPIDVATDINVAVIFDDASYMIFPSGTYCRSTVTDGYSNINLTNDYWGQHDGFNDIRLFYDIKAATSSIYQIIVYRNGHSNFVPCHWIDLSNVFIADSQNNRKAATNSGCDYMVSPVASIPGEGDNLCQLGYRFNVTGEQLDADGKPVDPWSVSRASAIILAAYNTIDTGWDEIGFHLDKLEAPCYAQYQFIKDFNLGKYRGTYFDANGGMIAGDVTFGQTVKERLKNELEINNVTYSIIADETNILKHEGLNWPYNENRIGIIKRDDSGATSKTVFDNKLNAPEGKRFVLDVYVYVEYTPYSESNSNGSTYPYCISIPFINSDDTYNENTYENAAYKPVAGIDALVNMTSLSSTIYNAAQGFVSYLKYNSDHNQAYTTYGIKRIALYLKTVPSSWLWKTESANGYTKFLSSEYNVFNTPTDITNYLDYLNIKFTSVGSDGLDIKTTTKELQVIYYAGVQPVDISDNQYNGKTIGDTGFPTGWKTYPDNFDTNKGEHLWMSQRYFTNGYVPTYTNWSAPIIIDGSADNKEFQMYWSYSKADNQAQTNDPSMIYAYANGIGVIAWDGAWRIYMKDLAESGTSNSFYNLDDITEDQNVSEHVSNTPLSVTEDYPTVYLFTRRKVYDTETVTVNNVEYTVSIPHWSYMTASIWSQRGIQGLDGAGMEYIYAINNDQNTPPELTTPNDWETNETYQANGYYPIQNGWSDEPFSVNINNRVCWYATRKQERRETIISNVNGEYRKYDAHLVWGPWSTPTIWTLYHDKGMDGGHWIFIYRTWPLDMTTEPAQPIFHSYEELNADEDWTDDGDFLFDDKTLGLWMSQAFISGDGVWGGFSTPIRISGEDGKAGEDGVNIEFIYYLSDTNTLNPDIFPPNVQIDDWYEVEGQAYGWTDHPQGVTEQYMYEFISVRKKSANANGVMEWGPWSTPVIWAKWGERGHDGDGMEYIYTKTVNDTAPANPTPQDYASNSTYQNSDEYVTQLQGWSDNPENVSTEYPFVWVSKRCRKNGVWGAFSNPAIWARWAAKGMDGSHYEFIYAKATLDNAPTKPANGTTISNIQSPWTAEIISLTEQEINSNMFIWMSQCQVNGNGAYGTWSNPIVLTGQNGKNGEDGNRIEFIYRRVGLTGVDRTTNNENVVTAVALNGDYANPNNINTSTNNKQPNDNDFIPTGWTDNPMGVTLEYPYEFVSQRVKRDNQWSAWSTPVVWSKWGEKGQDGDGMEYIYWTFNQWYSDIVEDWQEWAHSNLNVSTSLALSIWPKTQLAYTLEYPPASTWTDEQRESFYWDNERTELFKRYEMAPEITPLVNPTPSDYLTNTDYQNNDEYCNYLLGWTDEPQPLQNTDFPRNIQFVSVRKRKNGVWGRFSDPIVWNGGIYCGSNGISTINIYCKASVDNEGKIVLPSNVYSFNENFHQTFDIPKIEGNTDVLVHDENDVSTYSVFKILTGWSNGIPSGYNPDTYEKNGWVVAMASISYVLKGSTTADANGWNYNNETDAYDSMRKIEIWANGPIIAFAGATGKAGEDGADIEFLYARTKSSSTPPNIPMDNGSDSSWVDTVKVPETIKNKVSKLLSTLASQAEITVPKTSKAYEYLTKVVYEISEQYHNENSPYNLPLLYKKSLFPNVIDYYGNDTNPLAFDTMAGWAMAMVLTEIFPKKRNALLSAGYDIGPNKSEYIFKYNFDTDPNIGRIVASVIYAALRGVLKPNLATMRTELGAPAFNYNISSVYGNSFDNYVNAYYVDIRNFMPTAPGPYISGYTDRSSIGGVPFDDNDLEDHNLPTDLDIYNYVVRYYNLDNPNCRQATAQAIANKETTSNHMFGPNRTGMTSGGYMTVHPVFGYDTIGKEIATDGTTADLFQKIGTIGSRNRYWLQTGSYYGRKRPGQGNTDYSSPNDKNGVLVNFAIEDFDGTPTGYNNATEYDNYQRSNVIANSYPSGHSAMTFAGALLLVELMPNRADLIMKAANSYATDRQITRYHWCSDTIIGRLVGAAMAPVVRGSSDYDSLFNLAKNEVGENITTNNTDSIGYQTEDWGVGKQTGLTSSQGDTTWSDNPRGISTTLKYEWTCQRFKKHNTWGSFSNPVIWSCWGNTGMDGDGYEYVFLLSKTNVPPDLTRTGNYIYNNKQYKVDEDDYLPRTQVGYNNQQNNDNYQGFGTMTEGSFTYVVWSDEPMQMSGEYVYQFVSMRKKTNGEWWYFSDPVLWGSKGANGEWIENIYIAVGDDAVNKEYEYEGYDPRTGIYESRTLAGVTLKQWDAPYDWPPNLNTSTEEFQTDGLEPNGWSLDMMTLTPEIKYLFCCTRKKQFNNQGVGVWSRYSQPVVVGVWGSDGANGSDTKGYYLLPIRERCNVTLNGEYDFSLAYKVRHNLPAGEVDVDENLWFGNPSYGELEFVVFIRWFNAAGRCVAYTAPNHLTSAYQDIFGEPSLSYIYPDPYNGKEWFNVYTSNHIEREFGNYWDTALSNPNSLPSCLHVLLVKITKGMTAEEIVRAFNQIEGGGLNTNVQILDTRVVRIIAESGVSWKKTETSIETIIAASATEIVDEAIRQANYRYNLEQTAQYVREQLQAIYTLLGENGDLIQTVNNLNERLDTAEQHYQQLSSVVNNLNQNGNLAQTIEDFNRRVDQCNQSLHTIQETITNLGDDGTILDQLTRINNHLSTLDSDVRTISAAYDDYVNNIHEEVATQVAQTAETWNVTAVKNGLLQAGFFIEGADGAIQLKANSVLVKGPRINVNASLKLQDYTGADSITMFSGSDMITVGKSSNWSQTTIRNNKITVGKVNSNQGWITIGYVNNIPAVDLSYRGAYQSTSSQIRLSFDDDGTPKLIFYKSGWPHAQIFKRDNYGYLKAVDGSL